MKRRVATDIIKRPAALVFFVLALVGLDGSGTPAQSQRGEPVPGLESSAYPPVSARLSRLWLVPDAAFRARIPRALKDLAQAISDYGEKKYAKALSLLGNGALARSPLANYATYYRGLSFLALERYDDAKAEFDALRGREPVGYLSEGVRMRQADVAVLRNDFATAIGTYAELSDSKTAAPDSVLLALAQAATSAGDRETAARAFRRLYYDYPLGDSSPDAGKQLASLADVAPMGAAEQHRADVARAQRLFDARRYSDALAAFEPLSAGASGDEGELLALRIAECRFYLRRYKEARDATKSFIATGPRKAEALFFYLSAIGQMGQSDDYINLTQQLVEENPASPWAGEALNSLASYYVINDEDEKASAVFRDLYARFPQGRYAARAAWMAGWWAYRHGQYAETVSFFEQAAAAFPHSDYRPSWLYWSARAHEALDETTLAAARYRLLLTDYRNTYYGRLAAARLKQRKLTDPEVEPVALLTSDPQPMQLPANAEQMRLLLGLGLFDQAVDEIQYALRTWGESPELTATLAWAYNQRGDLRPAVNAMKRAYPQYMAAGGEKLPVEIRKVMFPLDYWAEIRKQANSRHVDPFLAAALILQESTFSPDIRSSANAIGLMQIVPSTGRRYAKTLRIRRFSTSMLTRPDTNLRLGMAYFSDLLKRFGDEHLALAGYNAGENRVAEWIAERPGLSAEEFIDDIPFPETRSYVKQILGAVEQYRQLYGGKAAATAAPGESPVMRTGASRHDAGARTGIRNQDSGIRN